MIQIAVCGGDTQFEELLCQAAMQQSLALTRFGEEGEFLAALDGGAYFQIVFLPLERGLSLGRRLRELFSFYETLLVYWGELGDPGLLRQGFFDTCPFQLLTPPMDGEDLAATLRAATNSLSQSPGLFVYRKNRAVYQVRKRDIACVESVGRNIELTMGNGSCARFIGTLKSLMEAFPEPNFVHPHLSYLVNLDHVEQYHSRHLVLGGGKIVPISERRTEELRAAALRYWKLTQT